MLDPSHDAALKQRIANGFVVESMDDMTPGYHKALKIQMLVQGDTELMSAPAYYLAAKDAPTISSRIAVSAVIQDELGHANIAYRLLEDLGEDKEQLVFGRQPHEFKNPYGFDQPLENWAEMAVANGLFDRAGIVLLSDVHQNTSYGPLKRALVKVDKEEYFHLRHGESWMRRLSKAGGEVKEMLQRAVGRVRAAQDRILETGQQLMDQAVDRAVDEALGRLSTNSRPSPASTTSPNSPPGS